MSLVRICMVTLGILRLFMCMCSRARKRERKKNNRPLRTCTEEENVCGSTIDLYSADERCSLADSAEKLKVTVNHPQVQKKPMLRLSTQYCYPPYPRNLRLRVTSYQSLGQYSRQQSQRMLDRCIHKHLIKAWLSLWKSVSHCKEIPNSSLTDAAHEIWGTCAVGDGDEEDSTPKLRIFAWSHLSDPQDTDLPSCSNQQERISSRPAVNAFEDMPMTLLDELFEKNNTGVYTYNECMAYFGNACHQRFLLPNEPVDLDERFPVPLRCKSVKLSLKLSDCSQTDLNTLGFLLQQSGSSQTSDTISS